MNDYPSSIADKIIIRLPQGMRPRLKAMARANHRSVNSEVVFHLEHILAHQDKTATGQSFAGSPAAASEPTAFQGGPSHPRL